MKRIILIAIIMNVMNSSAQDLVDKKGRSILPEKGDWGIAIDANPLFKFISSVTNFSGSDSNLITPNFNPLNNGLSVSGKYFKNATTVYRGTIRLYNVDTVNVIYLNKFNATPPSQTPNWPNNLTPEQVKDIHKNKEWSIGIGGGIEKRKGTKYRLQGIYGAEVSLIISGKGDKYNYGNNLVNNTTTSALDDNISLYTSSFNNNANILNSTDYQARILKKTNGNTFAIALRGFVGAEYFFTSKISLGGEFGWGMGWYRTGKGQLIQEGIDYKDELGNLIPEGVIVDKIKSKNSNTVTRGWFIGTDAETVKASNPTLSWMNSYSPSGKLSLNLYF